MSTLPLLPSALPVAPGDLVLTGDRPTGRLHLGHYAGSLVLRIALQDLCPQYVLVADLQALTDNAARPAHIASAVREVMLDYLSVGLDPAKTTFVLQSGVPELAELTQLYLNLVTVSRLERNPTVRDEIRQRGFARDIPAGFFCYPVAQAADITAFRATLVPAGADQRPMIEQANEIAATANRMADTEILPTCRLLFSASPRLPGVDGKAKMSKSLGNAVALSTSPEELRAQVRAMYTDPGHIRASDPGRVEGNVVFVYLDAFDPHPDEVAALKRHYQRGGLGDMALKERLFEILDATLAPIRARRAEFARDPDLLMDILRVGTTAARPRAAETLSQVRDALGVIRL